MASAKEKNPSSDEKRIQEKTLFLLELIDKHSDLAEIALECRNEQALGIFPDVIRKQLNDLIREFCIFHITKYKERDIDILTDVFIKHNKYVSAVEQLNEAEFENKREKRAAKTQVEEVYDEVCDSIKKNYRLLISAEGTYPRVKKGDNVDSGSGAVAAAAAATTTIVAATAAVAPQQSRGVEMSYAAPPRSGKKK